MVAIWVFSSQLFGLLHMASDLQSGAFDRKPQNCCKIVERKKETAKDFNFKILRNSGMKVSVC